MGNEKIGIQTSGRYPWGTTLEVAEQEIKDSLKLALVEESFAKRQLKKYTAELKCSRQVKRELRQAQKSLLKAKRLQKELEIIEEEIDSTKSHLLF